VRATARIKDLHLRTEIGFQPHEQGKLQDVLLNAVIEFETDGVELTDAPGGYDYRATTKAIIEMVQGGRFNLIEHVAWRALQIILADPHVIRATVEVDKPGALRFSRSVSIALSGEGRGAQGA
jgi:D-erythro-7,8-dihydroneopterin triphosphate epimerase